MNTLQLGCEALQREKMDMEIKVENLTEEKEKLVKDSTETKEQNEFLTQRNLTLVKKCETVCEENKNLKSKYEFHIFVSMHTHIKKEEELFMKKR